MAKPGWLNTSKSSGSGNDTVGLSTSAQYNGRVARSGNVTFRATGVADEVVSVSQNGRPEYVTIDSAKSVAKEGGNVTISGKTNSSKLTFSLGTGTLDISLPSNYTAHSVSTANGANISGDPGASQEIDYSIIIAVDENEDVDEKSRQIIVTANGGQTGICLLTQAADAPYLNVTPKTVTLDYLGTEQEVTVESNTSWEVI